MRAQLQVHRKIVILHASEHGEVHNRIVIFGKIDKEVFVGKQFFRLKLVVLKPSRDTCRLFF